MARLSFCGLVLVLATSPLFSAEPTPAGWSQQQVARLPKSETPVPLFNGRDLTGWHGQTEAYWSVRDGMIVARNDAANAPQASTYLLTDKEYRNFRLLFEAKLVTSEMHSGIALWGDAVERGGDPHSYQGHLVMFPSAYGFWDLYRRNSIYKDESQAARKVGHQHDWNRMEILAIGDRIQFALNGHAVADWTDPQPELCGSGPIGLQLHSNKVPQEIHFRGLILTENPEARLVTVEEEPARSQSQAAPRKGNATQAERSVAAVAPFRVDVRGSGRPMILIPGLSCGGEVWDETVDRFQDRYECHVLTLAGFAGQPAMEGELLLPVRDALIAYIREHNLEKPVIVGHSMGGLMAFWIAATIPQAVGPVIVIDGVPYHAALKHAGMSPEAIESTADRQRRFLQKAGPLRTIVQNRIVLANMISDKEDVLRMAELADRCDPDTVAQAVYELMTIDLREDIARIKAPVLMIGATGSSPTEEHRRNKEQRYREQVAAIPDCTVIFNAESRHFLQYDAPDYLYHEMNQFLQKHNAP